jgi:hypothetical protein
VSTIRVQTRKDFRGRPDQVLTELLQFDVEGKIVIDLITRWGMVAAMPDGEDSAGRQKLRLMTPEELVERAVESARLFVKVAKDESLCIMLDEPPPLQDEEA